LVLELTDNPETQQQYPFAFSFKIIYQLLDHRLDITYRIENRSGEAMPFAIGGHPGFRVPLMADESFEDYTITFSQPCQPDRVGFTPALYLSGQDERYPLKDDVCIDLHHRLFDQDAIILKNTSREVTLQSVKSGRGVRVLFPQMPYLGIWHCPRTDAPYVCIEPWSSLPARQDVVEDFHCKSDMIRLEQGGTYENTWSITIF
jgi:galactose mutarotase-like enzyme